MTARPLEFETALSGAFQAGDPVAVLLHGRGSDERDLLGLRPGLPPGVALVTPRAPFPGRPWGYGPGWAWYRYVAQDQVVPETLEASLAALDRFLAGLEDVLGAEPGPVVLGGFSQGGTTSLAYGLTRPDRVAGIANLSGFYVSQPPIAAPEDGAPPVFWGHGTLDPAIPFALALDGRQRLREQGVDVSSLDLRIGHGIAPEELTAFGEWVAGITGAGPVGAPGA